MSAMSDYQWSPPEHPTPTPEKVVSLDPDPTAVDIVPSRPVWLDVMFELRGPQRVVGFAMKASPNRVYAQMQFMSHTHYAWVARHHVFHRAISTADRR